METYSHPTLRYSIYSTFIEIFKKWMMYYLKSTLNEYVPLFIWTKSRYLNGGNSSWK